EALSDELLASIRLHLQQQRALGHDAFRAMVQAKTHRFAGVRPAHRPRNTNTAD
ncbi:MAG: transposase, partial [Xanthomonas perforans]|nr:transposase [Xanthomonas perforans]NEL65486.1 transposase [Xanthomonas perforans]NEL78908.1 transposase [Xanthomonas perforans]